jgi:hypothetical protein
MRVRQFTNIWIQLRDVYLEDSVEDVITWRLLANGVYSAAFTYKAQLFGATLTNMNRMA